MKKRSNTTRGDIYTTEAIQKEEKRKRIQTIRCEKQENKKNQWEVPFIKDPGT